MKKCSKCGQDKELSAYYYDNTKADKKHPECKSCFNLRMKETRKTKAYKIYYSSYNKEWMRKYRKTKKYLAWRKEAGQKVIAKRKELKQAILAHYGGKCICCGISEHYFLSIDHINNDGYKSKDRGNGKKVKNRVSGYLFYKQIVKDNYPNDLQILCFNCNTAKQHNGGKCPHKSNEIIL